MSINAFRQVYHAQICEKIIRAPKGYPNFADSSSRSSKEIAWGITNRLCKSVVEGSLQEQTVGDLFETITKDFIQSAFQELQHLRPGEWQYSTVQTNIAHFEQYEHLSYIKEIVSKDKDLASAFGGDYIVKPDIIIARLPVTDDTINLNSTVIDPSGNEAKLTAIRAQNRPRKLPLLHASISCKWTIRSDRSQNTRTEALNLIRNRKGHLPHIVAVTAEPLPTRIVALAMGTGDLDCVYHFALNELADTLSEIGNEDQLDLLNTMIEGRRLRDISDLPFDLAI